MSPATERPRGVTPSSWRTVRTAASILIGAPPARVAELYSAYERWPELFPATIRGVRLIRADEAEIEVEVDHRTAGKVPNVMRRRSPEVIELWERKPRYDATFVNRFEPSAGGTLYTVEAAVTLRGPYALLAPVIGGLVRRRVRQFVLEPMRALAERRAAVP